MPVIIEDGKIKAVSDLTDVNGTDPVELYRCLPAYVKFIISKIFIYNRDTADHEVYLGEYDTTNTTWNKDKFIIKVLAGQIITLTKDDLPEDFVMTTDPNSAVLSWAAKLDAAVTANAVKVKIELELG